MRCASDVLRRLMWAPVAVLLLGLGVLATWALDRAPPFAMLGSVPVSVMPGHVVYLQAMVRRDLSRQCRAKFQRWLIDSAGYRYDIGGTASASAAFIERLAKQSPGWLQVSIEVPRSLPPGTALLVTSLDYVCNPLHVLWPIEVVTEIPFTVLDADEGEAGA